MCLASNGYFETLNVGETIPANFTKHFPEESEHDAAWKTVKLVNGKSHSEHFVAILPDCLGGIYTGAFLRVER